MAEELVCCTTKRTQERGGWLRVCGKVGKVLEGGVVCWEGGGGGGGGATDGGGGKGVGGGRGGLCDLGGMGGGALYESNTKKRRKIKGKRSGSENTAKKG